MMDFLEKLACRFLIWRFEGNDGYGTPKGCRTKADWEDGMALEENGCAGCQATITVRFLREHIELIEIGG